MNSFVLLMPSSKAVFDLDIVFLIFQDLQINQTVYHLLLSFKNLVMLFMIQFACVINGVIQFVVFWPFKAAEVLVGFLCTVALFLYFILPVTEII